MRGRATAAVLAASGMCALACAVPEQAELVGLWGLEAEDGSWTVREFRDDPVNGGLVEHEWIVVSGAEPWEYRTCQATLLSDETTLPNGEIAEYSLRLVCDAGLTYDVVEDLAPGARLRVRPLYAEEPVEYEFLEAFP